MSRHERTQTDGRGAWLCILAIGLPLFGCGGDSEPGALAGSAAVIPVEAGAGGASGGTAAAGGSGATNAGNGASGNGGTTAGNGAGGSGTGGAGVAGGSGAGGSAGAVAIPTERFSFFVTSYAAMQRLSKSMSGFGGDLRYGQADGLSGADKICTEIAESSMPGSGGKGWRAFLSVTKGPAGTPIHAIDRIGNGPWYDRRGRLLAMAKADLLYDRPMGADPAIADDFPNEDGVPNHAPDGMEQVDNHDMLTGTNDRRAALLHGLGRDLPRLDERGRRAPASRASATRGRATSARASAAAAAFRSRPEAAAGSRPEVGAAAPTSTGRTGCRRSTKRAARRARA